MRPLPSEPAVSFRIQSRRWMTPLDLPLGQKYRGPGRFSIVVGELEEAYEISVFVWAHAAALLAILFVLVTHK